MEQKMNRRVIEEVISMLSAYNFQANSLEILNKYGCYYYAQKNNVTSCVNTNDSILNRDNIEAIVKFYRSKVRSFDEEGVEIARYRSYLIAVQDINEYVFRLLLEEKQGQIMYSIIRMLYMSEGNYSQDMVISHMNKEFGISRATFFRYKEKALNHIASYIKEKRFMKEPIICI